MLLRYSVENFLSFNDKIDFFMTPGRYRSLTEHIVREEKKISYLKNAIIYGANASGKSNFIKSIDFAKKFITQGKKINQLITTRQFKFEDHNPDKTSLFEFSFSINDKQYIYGFKITHKKVIAEWLKELTTYSEKNIFHRITTKDDISEVDINFISENKTDKQFLDFVAKGTRPNQLFLTECKDRNVNNVHIRNCYKWFRSVLTIIFPESMYNGLEIAIIKDKNFANDLIKIIKRFDIGMKDLKYIDVEFDTIKDIPKPILSALISKLEKNTIGTLTSNIGDRYIFQMNSKKKIIAKKLMALHKIKNSDNIITFELKDESDGTQRLFDIIPILIRAKMPNNVFIVDEIERSLHPSVCLDLIELFNQTSDKKSQLIVTTHNTNLLNFKLLRRDEYWFIEKNEDGESMLYSLEEYKPRYDKDIQTGYLKGRFGAIPMISKN